MKAIILCLMPLLYGFVASEEDSKELPLREKLLLAQYSTTTITSVSLITSTIYPSCLSGTSAAACNGRKRFKRTLSSEDLSINEGYVLFMLL